ncbi:universal stress protein [Mycolicibacterium pulveris]|uniref:Universal stress protein n=1 Tax=Mycolicibacterium pulveris TaxID=36813 RepID=A0A7I7UN85_MYCPV|nr:universal stress protein [Mycolicibacterium pulveris]MCV6981247.1 universal stress protein [Mycolicibacterium pulveris]BBY82311.1 universal stress protein [Mycolicibacterium pulveris]
MATASGRHGIVVGVDGSPASKVAVDWAAREAAMRDSALTLVHVMPTARFWPEGATPSRIDRLYRAQAQQWLREAAKVAGEATGAHGRIDTRLLDGAVLPALVDLSKDAQLIVVGCRGQGSIARRLMGSISRGLVQRAHCPVGIIHDEDPLMPRPVAQAPVVVGVDGSAASEPAAEIAFDEASRRGVELVAVHAWMDDTTFELPADEWSATHKDMTEQTLTKQLARWQQRYPEVPVRRVVVRDQPARQLVKQADDAQLVVVGSHGRGGFAGMLLGSVATAVAESARMPVIVARSS